MDFIERFFGVAPDGGSGSLELLILVLPLMGLLLVRQLVRRRRN